MTVDVLAPIVADIKVKLDVATTSVKGYGDDQWKDDSAHDIAVSLNALIVVIILLFSWPSYELLTNILPRQAIIGPINHVKGLNGDVAIINVFADIE